MRNLLFGQDFGQQLEVLGNLLIFQAHYQALERTPVRGRYRGHDIVSMPPSSSAVASS